MGMVQFVNPTFEPQCWQFYLVCLALLVVTRKSRLTPSISRRFPQTLEC